jgi:hypothetical protein
MSKAQNSTKWESKGNISIILFNNNNNEKKKNPTMLFWLNKETKTSKKKDKCICFLKSPKAHFSRLHNQNKFR